MEGSRFLAKNLSNVETIQFDWYVFFETWTLCHIRLCIATMLRARAGECVILLGMKCSSWTVVNQGTSKRAPCCPAGDTTKVSVRMANCMAARKLGAVMVRLSKHVKTSEQIKLISGIWWKICFPRTILLCLLALVTNNVYLLEQPFQTMLCWYGRFRHLMDVSRVSWLKDCDFLSCGSYIICVSNAFTCLDLRRTTVATFFILNLRSSRLHGGCTTTVLPALRGMSSSATAPMFQSFRWDVYWGGRLLLTMGESHADPTKGRMGNEDSMAPAIWSVLRNWSQCLGPMGYHWKICRMFPKFHLYLGLWNGEPNGGLKNPINCMMGLYSTIIIVFGNPPQLNRSQFFHPVLLVSDTCGRQSAPGQHDHIYHESGV